MGGKGRNILRSKSRSGMGSPMFGQLLSATGISLDSS